MGRDKVCTKFFRLGERPLLAPLPSVWPYSCFHFHFPLPLVRQRRPFSCSFEPLLVTGEIVLGHSSEFVCSLPPPQLACLLVYSHVPPVWRARSCKSAAKLASSMLGSNFTKCNWLAKRYIFAGQSGGQAGSQRASRRFQLSVLLCNLIFRSRTATTT